MFRCPNKECGHVAERDGSAARKILLLFIFVNTDQGYLMSSNGVSDASKLRRVLCRKVVVVVAAVSPPVFESMMMMMMMMMMNRKDEFRKGYHSQKGFYRGVVLLNADKV